MAPFPQKSINLTEIRKIIDHFPIPALEPVTFALQREVLLTKPAGSLGRLEKLTEWFVKWQGKYPPVLEHPRIAVFAGNHGINRHHVSAYPSSVTQQMLKNFIQGGGAINQLSALFDSDLRVYEMSLDEGTADFSQMPAMSEESCAKSFAYGMMAVEPGIDLLCLGEMGIGNTSSAAALCLGLFGGKAEDWVGYGTGINQTIWAQKVGLVKQAVTLHQPRIKDSFDWMRCVGGHELAAIAGAIIAARMARVPVVLDGFACTAAASVLYHYNPHSLDHCIVSHLSTEPGHKLLLSKIGKSAVLDLQLRLGEGTGAALMIPLIKAALACHNGMATFAEAQVSTKIIS